MKKINATLASKIKVSLVILACQAVSLCILFSTGHSQLLII